MNDGGYDSWKTRTPEDDGAGYEPTPCPVCTGERDAQPCSEVCFNLMFCADGKRHIRGCYKTAWKALRFARRYQLEGVGGDQRIADCVAAARRQRFFIKAMRAQMRAIMSGDEVRLASTMPAPALGEVA